MVFSQQDSTQILKKINIVMRRVYNPYPTNIFLLKMSAFYLCCIYSSTLQATFGPQCEKTCLRDFIQQRCRPACTSAQSDQRLCYSLIVKYYIYTCYEKKFNSLKLRRMVCVSLCQKPRSQVLLRRGPFYHRSKHYEL